MIIKGYDGQEHNVASNSKANAALTTGIIGTALGAGVLGNNGCGGGILGNLFGGNGNGNCYESKEAALLREQVATLRSENFSRAASTTAFEKSAEYTTRLHDAQAVNIKELLNQSIVQGVAIQRVDDKIDTQVALLKGEIATQAALAAKDREALAKDIQIEADKRCCGDNAIVNYSNQTFYSKYIADLTTKSTSTPENVYNPLPCGGCCGM